MRSNENDLEGAIFSFSERNCSVARAVSILSDVWAFLIIRECFFGARRFERFLDVLSIPRGTLASRLSQLCSSGILQSWIYSDRPLRREYRLTEKGRDLFPSMLALMSFGDRWLAGKKPPPLTLIHKACGCDCQPRVVCSECGGEIVAGRVTYRDGPGAGRTDQPLSRRVRQTRDRGQYENVRPCSVARTLGVVGDRWTFLIVREAFFGVRRFDDFRTSINIAPNILAGRLARLSAQEIVTRSAYQERPLRYEYRLTSRGKDLYGPLIVMMAWGDKWMTDSGPPLILTHMDCGHDFIAEVCCDQCCREIIAHAMAYVMRYDLSIPRDLAVRR